MVVGSVRRTAENEWSIDVNISAEIVLGLLTVSGGILSAAVAKMWLWFTGELQECKNERKELYGRTEVMHGQIVAISVEVSELKSKLDDVK